MAPDGSKPTIEEHTMLVALFTYLLLSGSGAGPTIEGLKDAQNAVQEIVVDEASRNAAVETIKEMADLVREYNKSKTDTYQKFEKVARVHATSPADLHAIIDPEREKILELQDRLVKLHSELKTHLTEDEWVQLYAVLDQD
jgi:hypothetical protein